MTIRIDKISRGEYEAWKVTPYPDGSGNTIDPINTAHISEPIAYGQSVDAWAAELDDNELEAALLIFTDRWTWDEGTPEDKVCLEAIEREKKRRDEQDNWLYAGLLSPGVSHGGSPPAHPAIGMIHVEQNGNVLFYDGVNWCSVSISSQGTIIHSHSHSFSHSNFPLPTTSIGGAPHNHSISKKSSP